ncbi:MAG TPA: histidine phosphatase family protein [Enhygromyxa sp.]|nr:histidine phosphatase family protein [Enhygromyxa sp.]
MRVILIRHGEAVSSSLIGDHGRHLSIEGRRQATATGRALAEHGVNPSRVWCSPLVRAVQTAELVVAQLDLAGVIEARDDLYSDSPADSLVRALAGLDAEQTVVVVGHQPYMSTATSLLLNYAVSAFATGSAYCLQVAALFPHRAELEWRWLA